MVLSEKGDEVKTQAILTSNSASDRNERLSRKRLDSPPRREVPARHLVLRVEALSEGTQMPSTEPDRPLEDFFKEGLSAREDGLTLHDNPYAAGSTKRREWSAGFCATTDKEDEDDLSLDPNDNARRRNPD